MALTILAQITATPGAEGRLAAALETLLTPTRAEDGCIQYDLHRDTANPGFFVFYEIWESRDHWQAHMKSPHIAAHRTATEGAVADVVLHELNKIG